MLRRGVIISLVTRGEVPLTRRHFPCRMYAITTRIKGTV